MNSLGGFAKQLHTFAADLDRSQKQAAFDAAEVLARSVHRQMPSRLRGAGGAKIDVKVKAVHGGALLHVKGPAHLIESDTRAHEERPRRREALRTPYGPRAVIKHPGTKGKHPFAKGVAAGLAEAKAVFPKALRESMGRSFR